MRNKMTRKQIQMNYKNVFRTLGETLYPLYEASDSIGWNDGVYGWNFNVFDFGKIAVLYGDRGTFGDPLPDGCVKVIYNARKYFREVYDWTRRAKYLKSARRKFQKELEKATELN